MEPLCLKTQMTLLLLKLSVFSRDNAPLPQLSNGLLKQPCKTFSAFQNRVLHALMFRCSGTSVCCLSKFDPKKLRVYLA